MGAAFLAIGAVAITAALLLGIGGAFIVLGATGAIVAGVLVIVAVVIGGVVVAVRPPGLPRGANGWIVAMGGALGLVLFMVVGVLVAGKAAGHYSWTMERLFRTVPEQPIDFPHPAHVRVAGIDCVFCHSSVDSEPMASVPPVEQCMFCHQVVGKDLPGVQQVIEAWQAGETIQWARVHRLPDHVRFVHEAHINYFTAKDSVPASAVCTLCHGEVGTMVQVEQVEDLRMGFCVDCHRDNDAPTDCTTCHY